MCVDEQNFQFLPFLLLLSLLCSEGESHVVEEKSTWWINYSRRLQMSCLGQMWLCKPCFEKAGDSVLFLALSPPSSFLLLLLFCPPLSLHFTSVHCFIILRRALLTSETPLCTQVLLKAHSSPQHPCMYVCVCPCVRVYVHVRVSQKESKRDGVIQLDRQVL